MADIKQQIAAVPIRLTKQGDIRLLLVTSRGTGRWVLPKGWPMENKNPWRAAAIEALEEAGVEGFISNEMIGQYDYDKVLPDGATIRCRVDLYPMIVHRLKRRWKERRQRQRHWFSPAGAAGAVDERELSELLLTLDGRKADKLPAIRELLKAS